MVIGAVIVTYNPKIADLEILINNTNSQLLQTVIVDNKSANIDDIEFFVKEKPSVQIVKLAENLGIGKAQNIGITKLLEIKEIEAVLLFDHDSHPNVTMIPELVKGLQELQKTKGKIGAVGPIFFDPRTQNNYPISVFKGFKLLKKYPVENDNTPIAASFLIASGSLIPRTTLEVVGLMKAEFFIDYIDIEWSFRAAYLGYPSFAIPFAKMEHQVGDDRIKLLGREISFHSPLRRYYLARNSILMLKEKHINWKYKVREVYYTVSRVVVYLLLVKNKLKYLKYISLGWYDGIMNKTGKTNRF